MFITNDTSLDARLARGHVTEELAVAAVVVTRAYRVAQGTLEPLDALPDPEPQDPPDTSLYVIWEGVSVTVAGHAKGPARPPFVRLVELRVGTTTRRLAVFGDRVWERSLGGLAASAPQPFDAIELALARAFGGAFDVPPGVVPGRDLPHPGYRDEYILNPGGVGYYADEVAARDAALPNIERPESLIQRWNDRPVPAAFSPCRELVGWRLHAQSDATLRAHVARGGQATEMPDPTTMLPSFRLLNHAPPDLIFDDLPPGTPVELSGLGERPLAFAVPACPARAFVRPKGKGRGDVALEPRLRVLHVNADRHLVLTVHDLAFRYDPRRAPTNVRVTRAQGPHA